MTRLTRLLDRVGGDVAALAERFDRSPATIARWLRDGVPDSRRDDVADAWSRSERASYAAQCRIEREAIQAQERADERERRDLQARIEAEQRSDRARNAAHMRWAKTRIAAARAGQDIPAREDAPGIKDRKIVDERGRPIDLPRQDGRTRGGRDRLADMIADDDPAWLALLRLAEGQFADTKAGKKQAVRAARDQWFSPTMKVVL
ncbi:MAG: hypothetical protein ACHQQR_09290 [Gemmatimonadales bacterium]